MKRYIADFVALTIMGAVCILSACSDERLSDIVVEDVMSDSHWQRADVNWHVSRTDFDAQAGATRSVDEGWKDGDRIYLILEDKDGNDVQAYVSYDGSKASWGQIEYDGYKSYLTCTTPRTVKAYYFDGSAAVTATDITFDATTGIYACTDGIYTYPADGDLEVSISLAPLTSRIRFIGEAGTKFAVASGMKSYTSFSRISGELTETTDRVKTSVDATGTTPYLYGVFANPEDPSMDVLNHRDRFRIVFDSSTPVLQVGRSGYMAVPTVESHRGWKQITIPATDIAFDQRNLVFVKGDTVAPDIYLTPMDATSRLVWSSSNTSVATVSEEGVVTAVGGGTATITVAVEENTSLKATCEVKVFDVDNNGHEFVDLGLPSGTLWATMNVGASSPEDYGGYYAWGETEEKSNYNWSNYKWCNGNEYSFLTKYCTDELYGTVDNKTDLEPEDDVAHVLWGGSWRIPTAAESVELAEKCIWSWIYVNGVNGYKVTGPNGNSIFLPAGGQRDKTKVNERGKYGYYWTSTVDLDFSLNNAYYHWGPTDNADLAYHVSHIINRYYGLTVRPVTK